MVSPARRGVAHRRTVPTLAFADAPGEPFAEKRVEGRGVADGRAKLALRPGPDADADEPLRRTTTAGGVGHAEIGAADSDRACLGTRRWARVADSHGGATA